MLCGGWSGAPELLPESKMESFVRPPKTLPRSIGHRAEWVQACKDGKPEDAKAGFAYFRPLHTEAPARRQPRHASAEADRVGREKDASEERAGSRRPYPQTLPRRIWHLDFMPAGASLIKCLDGWKNEFKFKFTVRRASRR